MGVEHVTNRMGRVGSSGGEVSVLSQSRLSDIVSAETAGSTP